MRHALCIGDSLGDGACRARLAEDAVVRAEHHEAKLAAMEVLAVMDALVLHDGAADARADDEERHVIMAFARTEPRLAERRAVCVVLHRDGQFEARFELLPHREVMDVRDGARAADDARHIVHGSGEAERRAREHVLPGKRRCNLPDQRKEAVPRLRGRLLVLREDGSRFVDDGILHTAAADVKGEDLHSISLLSKKVISLLC